MKKLVLPLFSLLLLLSCGREKEQVSTKFILEFGAISEVNTTSASSFPGGVIFGGKSLEGEEFHLGLKPSEMNNIELELAADNWTFYAIGWDGPNLMEGKPFCEFQQAQISGASASVALNLSSTKCGESHFTNSPQANSDAGRLPTLTLATCLSLDGIELSGSGGFTCPPEMLPESLSYRIRTKSFVSSEIDHDEKVLEGRCHTYDGLREFNQRTSDKLPHLNNSFFITQHTLPIGGSFPLFPFEIITYQDDNCNDEDTVLEFNHLVRTSPNQEEQKKDYILRTRETDQLLIFPDNFTGIGRTPLKEHLVTNFCGNGRDCNPFEFPKLLGDNRQGAPIDSAYDEAFIALDRLFSNKTGVGNWDLPILPAMPFYSVSSGVTENYLIMYAAPTSPSLNWLNFTISENGIVSWGSHNNTPTGTSSTSYLLSFNDETQVQIFANQLNNSNSHPLRVIKSSELINNMELNQFKSDHPQSNFSNSLFSDQHLKNRRWQIDYRSWSALQKINFMVAGAPMALVSERYERCSEIPRITSAPQIVRSFIFEGKEEKITISFAPGKYGHTNRIEVLVTDQEEDEIIIYDFTCGAPGKGRIYAQDYDRIDGVKIEVKELIIWNASQGLVEYYQKNELGEKIATVARYQQNKLFAWNKEKVLDYDNEDIFLASDLRIAIDLMSDCMNTQDYLDQTTISGVTTPLKRSFNSKTGLQAPAINCLLSIANEPIVDLEGPYTNFANNDFTLEP